MQKTQSNQQGSNGEILHKYSAKYADSPFAGVERGASPLEESATRHKNRPKLRAETLVECICAMHLTSYVKGLGDHRGGMWLVGPSGALKSTFLDFLDVYENTIFHSDLNVKTLMNLKGQFSVGSLRTLVLPELQKIYERDPRSAANIEGSIRAFAEEGFRGASFEPTGINRFRARACVIGAMTDEFQVRMWQRWVDSGFARRFLWGLIRLDDPDVLMRAVENWKLQDLGDISIPKLPSTREIENNLSVGDRKRIRPLVRYQPQPNNFCFEMLCKVACVLRWHYERRGIKRDALESVEEFSLALGGTGKEGADVVLGTEVEK